jgi:hypothetical protein
MKEHARVARISLYVFTTVIASAVGAGSARAQTPPPPAEAAPPPPPAPMPMPAATPPPPAPPPPMAPPPDAKPPTATEAMPATRPDVLPPIDVGAWLRVGGIFQGTDPSKVNDWHMDNAYMELHTGGKITKKVGVTLNLNANVTSGSASSITGFNASSMDGSPPGSGNFAALEDAIISFDFIDEFHLWAGHLLVPVDRSNASGPFFMIPWNYPGFFSGAFVGAPKEGPSGRNNGAVLWGDISGGKFSYFAGAFDNAQIGTSPLFSGRLRLALLDPEPGFWGNGSYFGDKDLLSINLGGQAQAHGSAGGTKTYADVNVDALFEKKTGGGSFVTGEGGYYHFNVGDGGVSDSLYVLAAYATPTVGVCSIQPMVRFQWEKVKANPITNPWNLDVAVSYLIKGPALRLIATYSYTKLLTQDATTLALSNLGTNSIQLGAQAIFF